MEREADIKAVDASDSIAAAIAHEVNNLLTPVIGLADLLEHSGGDAGVRDQLIERAVERCQRAVAICGLLLDVAKHGENEAPACNLSDVLRSAADTALSRAEEAGVLIECGLDEPGSLGVPGTVAEHILLNLILNAISASHAGTRVSITARYTPASSWQSAYWRVDIVDRGAGLDARSVAAVNQGGLPVGSKGIGLAVVRLLCERWGGRLSVQSELGAGSVFHVELPAA